MTDNSPSVARKDLKVIGLVGSVHGVSHFFQLVFPSLFPWLMADFNLSFAQVALSMSAFFLISGIGQAAAGFLVDRFGAARVLIGGMTCFVLGALALSMAQGLYSLIGAAALAGMGNAVFHPADFTALNRHVSSARLGHAFSAHGLSGNLGWALAPVFMTGIASISNWRVAAIAAGVMTFAILAVLVYFRGILLDPRPPLKKHAINEAHPLAFLGVVPVWMCFLFFFFITTAFGAIQNFAAPILQQLYGLSLHSAAGSLSIYLLGGAGGILLGGFLAKRGDHDVIIAVMLGLAASCVLMLSSSWPPLWAVPVLMAAVGFCTGVAGPSRDLLVRRAAVSRFGEAAYGRIYGFVYSGFDAGLALAPFIFGAFMDAGRAAAVLVSMAMLQCLAIFTAWGVGKYVDPPPLAVREV